VSSRVLVTGVNGFVGRHMVGELTRQGHEVVGVGHEPGSDLAGLADYRAQDLTTGWPADLEADAVVHLAGLSAVGPSFRDPQRYVAHNSAMVTHLCESVLAGERPRTRVLVVSSGAVYDARQPLPLTEESRIGFSSPYVVSKVLVENLVTYYTGRGLDAVVVRPFNHIGPGQGPGFLVPDLLAAGRSAAERGAPLQVGDLDTRRDYTDVRDVVRAYRLLLEAADLPHRLYNVCSGRSRSGREMLAELGKVWPHGDPDVEVDESRVRPGDPREIVGSADRIRKDVGWSPEVDVATSVRDFVEAAG
jgi:GDP-4-dehydro-6-deoxy-D-mannose reductase